MRAIKKILAFFIYAIPLFALASCYVGGTPCIESAEWESDKELSLSAFPASRPTMIWRWR